MLNCKQVAQIFWIIGKLKSVVNKNDAAESTFLQGLIVEAAENLHIDSDYNASFKMESKRLFALWDSVGRYKEFLIATKQKQDSIDEMIQIEHTLRAMNK